MNPLEKINEALTQAKTFYLATVEGDQPKCRPVAFHLLLGGKLYFGVGDFKDVYRQMQQNPKVELCALTESGFLRYTGRAVFQQDDALAKMVLAKAPAMQKLYNEQTGYSLKIFHLEDAVAEFRSQLQVLEQFSL